MKPVSQIALAMLAVVALVAGITFVKQYQVDGGAPAPVTPTSQASPGKQAAEVRLHFPTTIWEWKPAADGQFEQRSKGSRDFWFQNDNAVPVELGLKSKSCKCSDVSACVLPPDQAKRYREASANGGVPAIPLNPQPLEVDELKGVTVGPGEGGVVRLAWEDKKEPSEQDRSELLVVEVWAQAAGGGPKTVNRLELPVTFVPALRVTPPIIPLGDLGLGDEKTAEFKCWSSTRAKFSVTAKERSGEPCFTCSCTPLASEARKDLEKATNSHVLDGYLVRVTVHERLSDTVQMELGPFGRRIDLKSDAGIEPTSVLVTGVVRGDVTVGTEDDKGRIMLGFFSAKRGITKSVKLTAHRPGLDLRVERVEPEGNPLKVKSLTKLEPPLPGGRSKWELSIEVPPGTLSGALPDHSAVRLAMPGNPPRYIRIPVVGDATQ
jgi:hypothetical protein